MRNDSIQSDSLTGPSEKTSTISLIGESPTIIPYPKFVFTRLKGRSPTDPEATLQHIKEGEEVSFGEETEDIDIDQMKIHLALLENVFISYLPPRRRETLPDSISIEQKALILTKFKESLPFLRTSLNLQDKTCFMQTNRILARLMEEGRESDFRKAGENFIYENTDQLESIIEKNKSDATVQETTLRRFYDLSFSSKSTYKDKALDVLSHHLILESEREYHQVVNNTQRIERVLTEGSENQRERVYQYTIDQFNPYNVTTTLPSIPFYVDTIARILQNDSKDTTRYETFERRVERYAYVYLSQFGLNPEDVLPAWKINSYGLPSSQIIISNLNYVNYLEKRKPGVCAQLVKGGVCRFDKYPIAVLSYLTDNIEHLPSDQLNSRVDMYLEDYIKGCLPNHNAQDLVRIWKEGNSEDKYREIVLRNAELFKRLEVERPGIIDFLFSRNIYNVNRYPYDLLLAQFDQKEDISKPYGVAIYPQSDHNDAFTSHHEVLSSLSSQLQTLGYNIRLCEAKNQYDIIHNLNTFRKDYGKISFALLNGHGSPNSIDMGKSPINIRRAIYVKDIAQRRMRVIRNIFTQDPTLILISCSTGVKNGIGQLFSQSKFHVVAPDSPANINAIDVKETNGALAFKVVYQNANAAKVFFAGKQEQS